MKRFTPILLAISALIFSHSVNAQPVEAKTVPVGVVTVNIGGSFNGVAYNISQFSAPLSGEASIQGKSSGRISAVGIDTITVNNAGWLASALSAAGSPYFIQIKSGSSAGRIFQIVSNTDSNITVRRTGNDSGIDLTTLGIATGDSSGDTFEITPGDTLLSLLGTPADGVIGGTTAQLSANQVDKVLINDPANNVALFYFFDTGGVNPNQWRRVGSNANQGNLVISPKAGLVYYRISQTPLELTFTGKVPATNSIVRIPRLGTTIISKYYPVDSTLTSLGLHNLAGWKKLGDPSVTTATVDKAVVKVGSVIFAYYFDTTASPAQWRRGGSGGNQSNVPIPAGSSVMVVRTGAAGEYDTWATQLPYSLN